MFHETDTICKKKKEQQRKEALLKIRNMTTVIFKSIKGKEKKAKLEKSH